MTRILYAGRTEYAAAFADDPAPRKHEDRLRWAVRHALEDARRYGDIVTEIISINYKCLTDNDYYRCGQLIREEATACHC